MEEKGDKLAVQHSFTSALRYYELAVACEPRIVLKAYNVACKAHDWVADECVREGMDPRTP